MDNDFKNRLLGVAEDMLRSRRGFFQRFKHDLANDWRQLAGLSLLPANRSAFVRMSRQLDPLAGERAELADMIAFIAEWAGKQPAPESVEPLPALSAVDRHAAHSVGADSVLRHSTKPKARNTLDPAIDKAQSRCTDRFDTAEVWAQMQNLTLSEFPPLLALVLGDIKYTEDGGKPFTKDALSKRLQRRAEREGKNAADRR